MANPNIKLQVLQEFGLDPRKYWLNDDGDVIEAPDSGAAVDSLKSAAYNAPRTALGFVGGALGAKGGGALGVLAGPAAPVAVPAGAISGAFAGGAAGAKLGETLQDFMYPESWKVAQEARVARHPTATFASDVGASMLLMRPSPRMLRQVVSAPAEFLRAGGQVSPTTKAALLETGLGGAIEAGGTLAQGGSAGDVGLSALIGAVNSQPTRLGTLMSGGTFQPWRPVADIGAARASVADSLAQRREAVLAAIRQAEAERVRSGQQGPAEPEPTQFGSPIEEETGAVPTEGWNQFWTEFMPRMRAAYDVQERVAGPGGAEAAGSVDLRRGPDLDARVRVSERGYLDTAPHETAHLFLDDILNYGNPREQRFVETALRELGLEVETVDGHRRVRGADAEEGAVQSLGETIARRVAKQDVPVLDALRDFADYYLRDRMTPEAAQRMLSGRILHGRGTAPSVARAAGKLGAPTAPPPAEEVRPAAEPTVEPTAGEQPAEKPVRVVTSGEAERVQVARERARKLADLEAAFAERDAADAERRLRESIEELPPGPRKAERLAELDRVSQLRTVRGEEGESALTAEERFAADAQRFADTGGDAVVDRIDAGDAGFAEPNAPYAMSAAEVTPSSAVARPEERDITGQGFARSMLQQKANKQNERESAADLEMRRLEDRLAGRDRSRYQPLRDDQQRSPEFKNWFGDWEAVQRLNEEQRREFSPERQNEIAKIRHGLSKVVDGVGRPLVVYHGTKRAGFSKFDPSRTAEMGLHFGTPPQSNDFVVKPEVRHSVKTWEQDHDPDNLLFYQPDRADALYPVYLDIKNPFIAPDLFGTSSVRFADWLVQTGQWDSGQYKVWQRNDYYDARDGWQYIKRWLIDRGHDGVKYVNENEGNVGTPDNVAWIAFEPSQVKSATGNRGTFDRTNDDIRYQPLREADVLEIARSRGYTVGPIYHGTRAEDIKRFRQKETGIWAAFDKHNATPGSGDAPRKVLNLVADPGERPYTLTPEELGEWRRTIYPRNYVQNMRARRGATSIRIGDYALVVFKPEQLKSADAVTYDNKGQAISIDDRFDKTNKDIRYQPLGPERGSYGGVKLPKREQPHRGIFAGNVEALRRSKNPDKAYFADRAVELYANIRANIGRYEDAVMKPLLKLSAADQRALVEVMYDEDAGNKPLRHTLAARIRPAYDAVRAGLKLMRTDQNAANHMIDGKPAKIDPLYFPNIIDPTVLHDLSYNKSTARYAELKRQFIEYNTTHFQNKFGMAAADARTKAEELFGQFSGTLKPASIEGGFDFGPVTLRANSKLPPTWVAADPVAGFRSYIKRFSRARAFYDTVQRDERAMQLIGSSSYFDAAGAQQETTPNSIATDPNVRVLLEDAIGVTHESQEAITPALGRLANTLLLSNLATRLTDATTTPFKMLAYLPASRVPGFIGHLANIRQSIDNAYKTGGVRRGDMMVMRDVLGAGDIAVSWLDKTSQFITKWTGSEALEKGARFMAQSAGEYVYDVNSALARAGDKRALDFMNKLTPQWRTLPRAEVAQRIAQLFQGSYDATNLPIWIKNSPAAPFFSMLKWNVEQWNNFKRFAWQPLTQGDPVPMMRTLVGGLLGGLAVGELRELITGKKQRVGEFAEIADALQRGAVGPGSMELMRKLAFLSQVTGTLGVVGEVNLQVMDILAKDKPQGFSWPAYELARTIVDTTTNAVQAEVKRPEDGLLIFKSWANTLLTSIFSQYRVAVNALDRATDGATARKLGAGTVEESNRRRDLRVSQRLRGEEVRRTPYIEQDMANVREREFDKAESSADILENAKRLQRQAAAEAKTPEEFEASKRKFRAQRIAGIPSAENDPREYAAHLAFVRRTQGEEAARELNRTYIRLRARQKLRSDLFK